MQKCRRQQSCTSTTFSVPNCWCFCCERVTGGMVLQFQYQAGTGPMGVTIETAYMLNDNKWHTVLVERNRSVMKAHKTVYFSIFSYE